MDPVQTKFQFSCQRNPSLRSRNPSFFFPKYRSPHPVTLATIWHIWEGRSQKVNMEEPDLRFLSQKLLTCYKPCRSKTLFFDLNPKGPNPGFPDAGADAGRILKSRSRPLPTRPGMKYFRKETSQRTYCPTSRG